MIKVFNRTGCNTEPWGTPVVTTCQLDITPFTTILWAWPSRHFLTQQRLHPSKPWAISDQKEILKSNLQAKSRSVIAWTIVFEESMRAFTILIHTVSKLLFTTKDIIYLKIFVCISLHLRTEICYLSRNYKKWQIPWRPLKTWISWAFFEELLLSFAAGQWQDRNSSVPLSLALTVFLCLSFFIFFLY